MIVNTASAELIFIDSERLFYPDRKEERKKGKKHQCGKYIFLRQSFSVLFPYWSFQC